MNKKYLTLFFCKYQCHPKCARIGPIIGLMLLALFLFFVCVLFCYWSSYLIALFHRLIIGQISKRPRSYLTLSKLWPTWIKDKTYPSKCMTLKSVKPLFTLLKSVEHLFVSPLPEHNMQMSPGHLHTGLIFSKEYIWRKCNVIIISKLWTLRCCFDVMSGDLISSSLEFLLTVCV